MVILFRFFPFHCFNSIPKKQTLSVPAPPPLFLAFRSRTPGIGLGVKKGRKSKKRKEKKLTAFPTNNIVGNGRCDLQLSFTILGTDEDVQRENRVLLSVRIGLDGELSQPVFFTMIPAFSSSFFCAEYRYALYFFSFSEGTESLGMIKNPEF